MNWINKKNNSGITSSWVVFSCPCRSRHRRHYHHHRCRRSLLLWVGHLFQYLTNDQLDCFLCRRGSDPIMYIDRSREFEWESDWFEQQPWQFDEEKESKHCKNQVRIKGSLRRTNELDFPVLTTVDQCHVIDSSEMFDVRGIIGKSIQHIAEFFPIEEIKKLTLRITYTFTCCRMWLIYLVVVCVSIKRILWHSTRNIVDVVVDTQRVRWARRQERRKRMKISIIDGNRMDIELC